VPDQASALRADSLSGRHRGCQMATGGVHDKMRPIHLAPRLRVRIRAVSQRPVTDTHTLEIGYSP
jgi:hypothetical protein